jgi:flavin reductase (DIM6/NTAB) family NADH-FMN oxidoreductase RutF
MVSRSDWHSAAGGMYLATLECARVNVITAGTISWLGEVLHSSCREGEPLLFFASQHRRLHMDGN